MKVNTQTPPGNWSGEGLQGELWCPPTHSLSVIPKEKRLDVFLLYSSRKEEELLLPWQLLSQLEAGTAQPMKSHYTSNSQPPPMDSLLTTAPLSSPFLYQRTFHAFVLLACRWFAIEPHVPNCHSLLFLNKPILLEKYLPGYLLKVDVQKSNGQKSRSEIVYFNDRLAK